MYIPLFSRSPHFSPYSSVSLARLLRAPLALHVLAYWPLAAILQTSSPFHLPSVAQDPSARMSSLWHRCPKPCEQIDKNVHVMVQKCTAMRDGASVPHDSSSSGDQDINLWTVNPKQSLSSSARFVIAALC